MNPPGLQVDRDGHRIRIAGTLTLSYYRRVLAAMHQAATVRGYRDIELDFSATTSAYPAPMLGLLATCARLRDESDLNWDLIRPTDASLRRLFANANWAHLAAPTKFAESPWHPEAVLPASTFTSPEGQHRLVNRIMDAILSSPAATAREVLAAFEWAVNEITDNVLQHADTPLGGLVQLSHYPNARRLEFVVADAGCGIPESMRSTRPGISDQEALELAIARGITRDKKVGQGNGLFGTHRAAGVGRGDFQVHSGYASIRADLRASEQKVPLNGTLAVVALDYSDPAALWRALDIRGTRAEPAGDYVELRYGDQDDDTIAFRVQEEAGSVGSRSAGRVARGKLANLMSMYPRQRFDVDFARLPVVSSSFADEFLGKLFVSTGALRFSSRIRFRGVTPAVEAILDKAIRQRVQQEADDG